MVGVIIPIIVLTTAYIVLEHKYAEPANNRAIGDVQFPLIQTYQNVDGVMFYIDQASKYSVDRALFLTAERGGFETSSECGSFEGYNLWNNGEEWCEPKYRSSILSIAKREFDNKLKKYDRDIDMDYNFVIPKNELVVYGFADQNIEQGIYSKDEKIGEYVYKPNFAVEMRLDLNLFESIMEDAEEFLLELHSCEVEESVQVCLLRHIPDTWTPHSVDEDERKAGFDIYTGKKIMFYEATGVSFREVVIRFGLEI